MSLLSKYACLINVLLFSLVGYANPLIIGEGRVLDAAFSPDAQWIVTGSSTGIQVWNAETLEIMNQVEIERGIQIIKWSPDGCTLMAMQTDRQAIYFLDAGDLSILHVIEEEVEVAVYDTLYGDLEFSSFLLHSDTVVMSPDGSQFAYVSGDEMVVGRIDGFQEILRKEYADIDFIAFGPDSQSVINNEEWLDLSTGQILGEGVGHNVVAIAPDFSFFVRQMVGERQDLFGNGVITEGVNTRVIDRSSGEAIVDFSRSYTRFTPQRYYFPSVEDSRYEYGLWIRLTDEKIIANIELDNPTGPIPIKEEYPYQGTILYPHAFSPDGQQIITNFSDENTHSYADLGDPGLAHTLNLQNIISNSGLIPFQSQKPFSNLGFIDVNTLFTVSNNNAININLSSGESTPISQGVNNVITNDGSRLAFLSEDSDNNDVPVLVIRESPDWETTSTIALPVSNFYSNQAFIGIDDDLFFLTSSSDALILNIQSGEIVYQTTAIDSTARDIGFSELQPRLVAPGFIKEASEALIEWNYEIDEISEVTVFELPIVFCQYISDELEVLVVLQDGSAYRVVLENGEKEWLFQGDLDGSLSFNGDAFDITSDDRFFVVNSQIWDLTTNQLVTTYGQSEEPVINVVVNDDMTLLVNTRLDGTLQIHDFQGLIQPQSEISGYGLHSN